MFSGASSLTRIFIGKGAAFWIGATSGYCVCLFGGRDNDPVPRPQEPGGIISSEEVGAMSLLGGWFRGAVVVHVAGGKLLAEKDGFRPSTVIRTQ